MVCYDIVNDHRRNAVSKILENCGQRVQYSVFECDTDESPYLNLALQISREIDGETDSVRFYPLCHACASRVEILGAGTVTEEVEGFLLL